MFFAGPFVTRREDVYRGGVELTSEFWKRTWLEIWPRRQGNRVRKKMEGRRHALTRHRFVALMSFPFQISPQRSPISNENCGNEVRVLRAFTPTSRVGLDKRQDRHEFRTKIVTSFVIGEKECWPKAPLSGVRIHGILSDI